MTKKTFARTALLILDGWGIGPDPSASALAQANTPYMDSLMQNYPWQELQTYGEAVGLPEGQMGNSEVGHLNLGAGRVVYQDLAKIHKALREGELTQNALWQELLQKAHRSGRPLHIMGLCSDGGVHSHIEHLLGLCKLSQSQGALSVAVHAFLDGRDCDPHSGKGHIERLEQEFAQSPIQVASVIGRYYAMDRDKRWERTAKAYHLLCSGQGSLAQGGFAAAIAEQYAQGISDEFMPALAAPNMPRIEPGDVVLCFNFRTDRCRQLSRVLSQNEEEGLSPLDIHYYTMTRYDESFRNIGVLFEKENIKDTLGEVLSKAKKSQLRIAETEKYPHVSFFFSGGREEPFLGEERCIVPSPQVATYDLAPEMSARKITDELILRLKQGRLYDFICLNYANADMVGHTGDMQAAIRAAEEVDKCLANLVLSLLEKDYALLILADHGNSDCMKNPDGSPHTAHTTNPVPCILLANPLDGLQLKAGGKLGDIAPSILDLLGLEKPEAMTAQSLILRS